MRQNSIKQPTYLQKSGPKTHYASSLFHEYMPEKLQIHDFTYRNRLYNVSRPNLQSRYRAQNTLNSRFHVRNDPKKCIKQKCVCVWGGGGGRGGGLVLKQIFHWKTEIVDT